MVAQRPCAARGVERQVARARRYRGAGREAQMLPQAAREHEKKQPMSSSEQERAPPARTAALQLIDDPETMRQSRRAARKAQERTEAAEGPVAGRVLQPAVAARATQERRAAFEVTWGSRPQQRESVGGVFDAPVAQGSEAENEQQDGRVMGRLRGRLQHQQQEQRQLQPAVSSS
jgi:hypothetical protein